MRIECPKCHLSGQISDINVPPEGMGIDCPRCKERFFVRRQAQTDWRNTATDCPACQYSTFSDERFDICPQCGLVIKEYNERKQPGEAAPRVPSGAPPRQEPVDTAAARRRAEEDLRRLEEQSAKRKYTLDGAPLPLPDLPAEEVPKVELPLPVSLTGWGFVAVAAIAILYSFTEITGYYAKLGEVASDQVLAEEFAATHSVWGGVVFPLLQIVLAGAIAYVAVFFLRLRPWARQWLEHLSWGAVAYLGGFELVSLVNWIRRSPDDASFYYYFIGVVTTIVLLVLLVAPLLAAIRFLRDDRIGDSFE